MPALIPKMQAQLHIVIDFPIHPTVLRQIIIYIYNIYILDTHLHTVYLNIYYI